MRPVTRATLDGRVRHEPGVAPAPDATGGRIPASDIRPVLIRDSNRPSIERCPTSGSKVEDKFVTVIDEPLAVDRFVVAHREVALKLTPRPRLCLVDYYRLDPVDGVLELEVLSGFGRDVECGPGSDRCAANVKKHRARLS